MRSFNKGLKISELRRQKAITQKELAELCKVDIRTIQRIESGEVVPRMSTLKLIADGLECDIGFFTHTSTWNRTYSRTIILTAIIAGIIQLVNFIFFTPVIPGLYLKIGSVFHLLMTIIYVLSGLLFYLGFHYVGKYQNNKVLYISAIINMVLIPLFAISEILISDGGLHYAGHLNELITILLGLNGFVFGTGLFMIRGNHYMINLMAGSLEILISFLILIPVGLIQLFGLWIAIPYMILLIFILKNEINGIHEPAEAAMS
jgi:transcriptional regulator with XRE-family HTH domain